MTARRDAERMRSLNSPQSGQIVGSLDVLIFPSAENTPHSSHRYSYIGMALPLMLSNRQSKNAVQDVLATSAVPVMIFFGPSAFGFRSKSKISVGSHKVAQAFGISTTPLIWPSTGAVPRIATACSPL